MKPQDETLLIIQADREAYISTGLAHSGYNALIRSGGWDHSKVIQAFARHRLSHSTPGDAEVREAIAALRAMLPLVKLITVRQAIEAGVADEIGLNPWAINEGLAGGDEPALSWWKIQAIEEAFTSLATPSGRAPAWLPISEAPHACHVLAAYFDSLIGEWICEFVPSPPSEPWTHFMFAAPPAQDQTKGDEA